MKGNLYSREVVSKYGKMPYPTHNFSYDATTHKSIREYVIIPLDITQHFTDAEIRYFCNKKGIPHKKSSVGNYIGNCEPSMDILRQRIVKARDNGEFTNNTYDMVKWWSRDDKHVYLYSGIAKGEPYMSWSAQMFVAYQFATTPDYIELEGNSSKEMEVRVMKVPLDRINEFTYYTVGQCVEVLVDIDHPSFKEFYADSYGLTPEEAVAENALFVDPFYDYNEFPIPRPLLSQYNDYPYSLCYPPYPQVGDLPAGSKWSWEDAKYE